MQKVNHFEIDKTITIANRNRLFSRKNLLFWYQELYNRINRLIPGFPEKKVLEVGSGMSPLKYFYPHVITSDVMDLDYVDFVLDAHHIDKVDSITFESLDVITCTNVLHHLRDPISFLMNASHKLKSSGKIVVVEPYFSLLSRVIYKNLHHEPSDFSINEPKLPNIIGPLSSANMAIPYLIFFGKRDWDSVLKETYCFSTTNPVVFSGLSYMATGGVSKKLPIPHWIYRTFFKVDRYLSNRFPEYFGAFFIMILEKRQKA